MAGIVISDRPMPEMLEHSAWLRRRSAELLVDIAAQEKRNATLRARSETLRQQIATWRPARATKSRVDDPPARLR